MEFLTDLFWFIDSRNPSGLWGSTGLEILRAICVIGAILCIIGAVVTATTLVIRRVGRKKRKKATKSNALEEAIRRLQANGDCYIVGIQNDLIWGYTYSRVKFACRFDSKTGIIQDYVRADW